MVTPVHHARMSSLLHRFVGALILLGSLASCSTDDPGLSSARLADEESVRAGQAGHSLNARPGSDSWGMEPPETRRMRQTKEQAMALRSAANQATGAERERLLQLAEGLDAQMAATRRR
jgi:hypothetical protein